MSAISASDGYPQWESRIPGRPVAISYEPPDELRRHCAHFAGPLEKREVREGFTPDCETKLDEQFLDEIPPLMPFEATDNRLTWRYVFDQPMDKRRIVLDALAKPECLSVPNTIALEVLAEQCRADAIADYAVLKYKCAGDYYNTRLLMKYQSDFPWHYVYSLDRLFNNESYWQQRRAVENGYFRYAWLAAKCAGFPNDVLASLGVIENTMDFGGQPLPGDEGWWWIEQGYEAYYLMGVADRLSLKLVRTEYGYDPESISTWQRVKPVTAELFKVKNPGYHSDANLERAQRLKHFIAASTWMKIRRTVLVSEEWLLEQIEKFSDEELIQAANEATAMMDKQETDTYRR